MNRKIILGILIVLAGTAAAILFVSAPAAPLLGQSAYRIRSAIHGLSAGLMMVTITIGFYQAIRLWVADTPIPIREMEIGSIVNAGVCFLTVLSGNWIYIPYRAAEGPKSYFLETSPEVHKIFFEFKEYTSLLTLPLLVAAAYLICRYGERLNTNRPLREMTALLLVLAFFYFAIAFGLGAAITKLQSV
jgi:cytochrome bd-type quinol oxidase subunit 1